MDRGTVDRGTLEHMYLAVDIGGTKTLVAAFDEGGKIIEEAKFATPKDYDQFVKELANCVATLTTKEFRLMCMAVPGLIYRKTGVVYSLGNLPWSDKPIRDDVSKALGGLKVLIEHDVQLAGLYMARDIKDLYENILYITVSTGIGGALITDGKIVKPVEDMEIGKMPLQFEGKLINWEDFASGRVIVETYGKRASEIDDPDLWHQIGLKIAYGLAIASASIQPDVIVFGGGAGKYAESFIPTVQQYMEKNLHANCKRPKLVVGKNPEEAVIYGCYELAKQHYDSQPTQ